MELQPKIKELIAESVKTIGLDFWGSQVIARGSILRIYIDKAAGVTVDDCAQASQQISLILDDHPPLPGEYTLEVSSPGLDRLLLSLNHWHKNIGKMVSVEMFEPLDGKSKLRGRLVNLEEDRQALLECQQTVISVPLKQVKRARLVPEFKQN